MNAEALLARTKGGDSLSAQELDTVRQALASDLPGADKYTLIQILWRHRDLDSRSLLEFSLADADQLVRRIALQALSDLFPCDEVFDLARAAMSDPSEYVRMVAAVALGSLGASLPARGAQAAIILLDGFEHGQATTDLVWEGSYEGLLDLAHVPLRNRPLPTRKLRLSDIDPVVLASARALATGS